MAVRLCTQLWQAAEFQARAVETVGGTRAWWSTAVAGADVGVIEIVGPGVTGRAVGEWVAVPGGTTVTLTSVDSEPRGWTAARAPGLGWGRGGQVEQAPSALLALSDADAVVPVPDGLSLFDAAVLMSFGAGVFRAASGPDIGRGRVAGVFGLDGAGHLAVQYVLAAGGTVVAVDAGESRRRVTASAGAVRVVDPSTDDPVRILLDLGGADVAFVAADGYPAFEQALRSLRPGGRVVGLMPPGGGLLTMPRVSSGPAGLMTIESLAPTREDVVAVFHLHATGQATLVP